MKKFAILALILFFLVGVYLITGPKPLQDNGAETPQAQKPKSISIPDDYDVGDNYEKYENAQISYEFYYSKTSEVALNNGVVSVNEFGPTQTEGTEVYDGYFVNVREYTLGEQAFDEFVLEKLDEARVHSEITESLTPMDHDAYEGYTFTTRGLGTFPYVYLSNGTKVAEISYLVADPANIGFQSYVDTLIESFMFK